MSDIQAKIAELEAEMARTRKEKIRAHYLVLPTVGKTAPPALRDSRVYSFDPRVLFSFFVLTRSAFLLSSSLYFNTREKQGHKLSFGNAEGENRQAQVGTHQWTRWQVGGIEGCGSRL